MVSLTHVYKTYPGPMHALKNVTLQIDKGEFLFLTGPSGAGKTTLFRLLSAFDRPTSGSVNVCGHDLSLLSTREVAFFRRRIGVVFQDFRLLKNRTIFDNVALPLWVQGTPQHTVERRVREVLEQVSLGHKSHDFPDHLSGGEQQRASIARAIVHRPGFLIADEPTGNLDPQLSWEIIDLLDTLLAQGTTIVVATHDVELVKRKNRREIRLISGALEGGTHDLSL